ncbi:helicase-related protein [Marinobacter sp. P4B1]|uniref:helicase-related protein n=1 Tax=Marinobacter sp. P4B1 TaxID=1119533 RepID=UPI00071DDC47|nr:helicase-related protein [Marinobacter sp. P4B1]KRW83728.1 hypothetical protein AQ621_16900 [Marinobacter sp. P4B1]
MSTKPTRKTNPLGKIQQLGPKELWQAPLLLPKSWDDLRFPVEHFGLLRPGTPDPVVVIGVVAFDPDVRFGKVPRTVITLWDVDKNPIRMSFFGDTRNLGLARGQRLGVTGVLTEWSGQLWLNNPSVVEEFWLGRMRPNYPGKPKVIKAETVRSKMLELLPAAIPEAAEKLRESVEAFQPVGTIISALGYQNVDLEKVIRVAHVPKSKEAGEKAQHLLECIAAFHRVSEASRYTPPKRHQRLSVSVNDARELAARLPFTLDKEQMAAVLDMVGRLGGNTPMRHMISGDVGSGKTAVFACVAAAAAKAGARVAIMAPMGVLAAQTLERVAQWWPELSTALITGAAPDNEQTKSKILSASILAGSTALLHRDVGELDLVIVDEQQRFSRSQREGLCRRGDEHLIEATATCIPRSMALMKFGQWSFSRLQGAHVKKNITTEIVATKQSPALAQKKIMQKIQSTLAAGREVLVIYPLKEESEPDSRTRSVEEAAKKFEKLYPGMVASISGGMTEAEKNEAIEELKSRRKRILVATSVIEVGVDIPGLQRVVVVSPERMGLAALHQIRGRVARAGGQGYMDLYLPDPIADHSKKRLEALVATQDGFELTEIDMEQRGIGDISQESNQQSGSDETLLFGRVVTYEAIKKVEGMIRKAG